MTAPLDHIRSLERQLYEVRGKIVRLRRSALADGVKPDELRLEKLKVACGTLQERIAIGMGAFAEAAE